jgi:chemotaxis protein CheD
MREPLVLTVGISDCKVSRTAGAALVTHALGSCLAVVVYDPLGQVAGLLHFMLPDSSQAAHPAGLRLCMYADTGIPELLRHACQLGAARQRMRVALIGGAQLLRGEDSFQIGRRNHLAARQILWNAGILVQYESVGGTLPRTVRIAVDSGALHLIEGTTGRQIRLCKPTLEVAR